MSFSPILSNDGQKSASKDTVMALPPSMNSFVGRLSISGLRLSYTPSETLLRRSSAVPFLSRSLQGCQIPRFSTCRCSVSTEAKKEKVIVISGPTGAGKSRLALELAKRLNGEIVSADSVQVYRGLDVGSAKPSFKERQEVPHHLIDILHPTEDYSAGQFFEDGRIATRDILDRGRVPIITGGTGLYLRWFIYGKPDVPKASQDITLEAQSQLADLERIYDWESAVQLVVKAGDPGASSLAANDWYRLRRRLEIIKSTGSPASAFALPYDSFKKQFDSCVVDCSPDINSPADEIVEDKQKNLEYDFICFFLSTARLDLYRSIDFRCEDMISGSDGILSEARWLLDMGLMPTSNSATKAIGYRQGMEYLLKCEEQGDGSSVHDFYAFLSEFQKASRNFAKRQITWFRNEPIYHWINASRPLEEVVNFIYSAYHDRSDKLTVPEPLTMKKDMSNRQEIREMNSFRSKNRLFIHDEDCLDILKWISKTQGQTTKLTAL